MPAGTGYMVDHGSLAAQSGFPPLVATMLLASLLKLLAGLIEPVCGTVTINDGGCRIYDADSRWKAGRLAYVHQESTVFNETLRDNITLHRPWLTDDDIVRACEVAGINEGMMDPVVGLDSHRFGISTASMSWIMGRSSNPVRMTNCCRPADCIRGCTGRSECPLTPLRLYTLSLTPSAHEAPVRPLPYSFHLA